MAAGAGSAGVAEPTRGDGDGAGAARGGPILTTRSPGFTVPVSLTTRHEAECSARNATSSSATVCPPETTFSRSPTARPAARPPETYTDVAER